MSDERTERERTEEGQPGPEVRGREVLSVCGAAGMLGTVGVAAGTNLNEWNVDKTGTGEPKGSKTNEADKPEDGVRTGYSH